MVVGSGALIRHLMKGYRMFCLYRVSMYAAVGFLVFGAVGVSSAAEPKVGSVTGTITLDGKPLGGGRVFLHDGDGQFVGAYVSEKGTFSMKRVFVGEYKRNHPRLERREERYEDRSNVEGNDG